MKKLLLLTLISSFMLLCVACTNEPEATSPSVPQTTTEESNSTLTATIVPATSTEAPETIATYSVIISHETADGTVNMWEITGVFAEGTFMSENIPLRVFYVTEENSATILSNFAPYDYPYVGAYVDNNDGTFSHNYDIIKEFAHFERFTDDYGDQYIKAGSAYRNLPKGSWFFGDSGYSNSFFIVVGDKQAAQNGTVPSM